MAPFSNHHSWVLIRGTPVNPPLILTNRYLHCFAPQLTFQTRSKYGPALRESFVVFPVITSRPLRLPYAHNTILAGFIRLESCLPQLEFCGDAGISGPTSVIFHRMWYIPVYRGHWPYPGSPSGASTLSFPDGSGLLPINRGSACILA